MKPTGLMRAFDAFAIASFHEGTPFALLQAMAMEMPIIASRLAKIPESSMVTGT